MRIEKYMPTIKKYMPTIVINFIRNIRNNIFDGYALKSYSQEGEDMILRRIFEKKENGFYVDVGAHHPKRFSNTYFFYKNGWRGINIDAMPGSMDIFNRIRPRDINIEVPISNDNVILTYYAFNEPALNGFSRELSESRDGLNDYEVIFTKQIQTKRLDQVLQDYLPDGQLIDFLSIDVEGLDFEVLKSIPLFKYKPEVILVEILKSTLDEIKNNEIYKHLIAHGYVLLAKCVNTLIFKYQKITR